MRSLKDKGWDDDVDAYALEHQRAYCDWEYLNEMSQGGDPQFDTDEEFCDAVGMDLDEYRTLVHRINMRYKWRRNNGKL